jgi:hypothetical protein
VGHHDRDGRLSLGISGGLPAKSRKIKAKLDELGARARQGRRTSPTSSPIPSTWC